MRWLSLSLLRLDDGGDLVNCRLTLVTTSSQPTSHRRQSQGLVGRFGAADAAGVELRPYPGDPTCEKALGFKNSAHASVSIGWLQCVL